MVRKTVATLAAALLAVGAAHAALTLDVTPDHVTDGTTVTVSVTGADPTDLVFLAAGTELGETSIPIGTTTLDLGLAMPFSVLPLGVGDTSFQVTVPVVPPPLLGTTLYLQAFSIGFDFAPPNPPSITAEASNIDSLTF